ncbi:MAG: ThiF family adenylyltransferase, partial [Chloroflexota bacterium]
MSETIVITDPDTDRYHTFSYISWWKQEVVRESTALVIGAGALGNEVLKNLALMGIGHLIIADFDTIEDSNLSRSVLFRASDRGRRKVDVAAERVKELNPDVKVNTYHGDINHGLGLGVFRHVDVIVGCLDNREARLSIDRFAQSVGRPWVDGAIQELMG